MKDVLNRKNLLLISISLVFVIFSILVSFGLNASYYDQLENHFFVSIVRSLGLELFTLNGASYAFLSLILIYLAIFIAGFIFIKIEAKKEGTNILSPFWITTILCLIAYCLFFSFGIGSILYLPLKNDAYLITLKFVGEVILLALIPTVILFLIGIVTYLIVKICKKGVKNEKE